MEKTKGIEETEKLMHLVIRNEEASRTCRQINYKIFFEDKSRLDASCLYLIGDPLTRTCSAVHQLPDGLTIRYEGNEAEERFIKAEYYYRLRLVRVRELAKSLQENKNS